MLLSAKTSLGTVHLSPRVCPKIMKLLMYFKFCQLQVNLCQKLFFLQNMVRTCCVQKLFWLPETISVHNMFSSGLSLELSCIELCNSMNNLLSYYGLVDAKIRASDKDLPGLKTIFFFYFQNLHVRRNLWILPRRIAWISWMRMILILILLICIWW